MCWRGLPESRIERGGGGRCPLHIGYRVVALAGRCVLGLLALFRVVLAGIWFLR